MKPIYTRNTKIRSLLVSLRPLLGMLILATLLVGCVLPGAVTPVPTATQEDTPQANPAYTAAAQTIIAQLTALAPTETVQPAGSPATRATLTSTSPANPEPSAEETQTNGSASLETETASPTPEPTSTVEPPTPTTAPQPSPTPASNDPKAQLGSPDWSESFANTNNWPLFEDEHVHFTLKDGHIQLLAKKPEKWDGWMLSWTTLYNFYLEVTASPQNCSGTDRYGLLARAPSADKAYLFGFTCDGQYSLRKWNGERFSYLVDWTASDLIHAGAGKTNRLGLMADGDQISLYANGELLTEITDRSYEDGAFGLFISSSNTENLKVLISEVAYWELP